MQNVSKVTVSLPRTTLRSLERERKRLRRSRSAVVTLALDRWLGEQEHGSDDHYVRGYLRHPERIEDVEVVAAAAAAEWKPWE